MDKIYKCLIFDNQLSLSVIQSTDMVNRAIKIHSLSPTAAAAFGRTITACTFMASGLKNDKDKLSVTVSGDGEGGRIMISGDGHLNMRGSMDNPTVELPLKANGKLDVSGCVGKNGRITVVKSMGLKEPYSGTSKLVTGEIAEDFTAYYAISEQMPTAMALGVKIGKNRKCIGAGGVIIQALPFAEEKNLIKAEEIINNLKDISSIIEEGGAEKILNDYFDNPACEVYYPKYKCLCNRNYLKGVLCSLGKTELENIIKEQGTVSVNCDYCNKTYEFTEQDIQKLFNK